MSTTPTVFILGAGSSAPYGFPLGSTLRAELCKPARRQNQAWLEQVVQNIGLSSEELTEFSKAFLHSGNSSIDIFLSRNFDQFGEIGKFAIACILIGLERPERLYSPDPDSFPPLSAVDDDWYFELWNRLLNGAKSLEDLAKNQIKFITFNYDRSLEHYLFCSCKNSFKGVSDDEALKVLTYFQILHVDRKSTRLNSSH